MTDNFRSIRQRLIQLNLFDSETDDQHLKRNEILSTRVYIITLLICLSLFMLYTSLSSQTGIVIITAPTQQQYEKLALKFSSRLQCPCKNISIPYNQFISIIPQYNQICSSDFVSQKWIDYLFYENTSYYFQLDFRHSASSKFQILRTLCQQAQKTINDSLEQFYSTQLITNQLVSTRVFDAETNSTIELFQQTTFSLFQNVLKVLRQTITGNELFSAVDMHSVFQFYGRGSSDVFINNIYYYETILQGKLFDCYCDAVTMCQLPEGIYAYMNRYDYAGSNWINNIQVNANTAGINATFLVPGMYASCMPIESLMHSTSECLYEQSCLNQIAWYVPYSLIPIDSFSVLNQSQATRNITIEVLANNLFLERWIISKSYEKYFDYCQPLSCQYSADLRRSFIYILAVVISLYGGLRIVLKFLIPVIVTFIRKTKNQQERSITIDAPTST